ncbi:MAG: hypothetical protein ACO3I1_07630 [Burkholderiales bacterium]
MFQQYAVFDNFLDDPGQIVKSLQTQRYYLQAGKDFEGQIINDIPLEINYGDTQLPGDPRFGSPNWIGYRTRDLQEIDVEAYQVIVNKLFNTLFSSFSAPQIEFEAETHYHILTEDFTPTPGWFHTDQSKLLAGVLYLAENPPPNSGTIVHIGEEKHEIENRFNRLIIYNSNLVHSVQGCFGNSMNTARATFVFFIRNLSIYNDLIPIEGQA